MVWGRHVGGKVSVKERHQHMVIEYCFVSILFTAVSLITGNVIECKTNY